jgi:hypothetical protein
MVVDVCADANGGVCVCVCVCVCRLATLGEGAGTIGRTGALPALVNKLHRLTLSSIQVYMCPYRCLPSYYTVGRLPTTKYLIYC